MKKTIECWSEEVQLTYNTTLGSLLEKLHEIEEEVPRDAEMKGYISGYDDEYYSIHFKYWREETEYEYQDRINKEKRVEDDEKEIYRRLKAKFGDTE